MRGAQPRTSSHMLSFQENASLFYANSQVSQTAMRKTDLPRRNGRAGVARPCRVDHRLREGMSRYASTNRRYFDNARQAFDEWARALGPLPARPALPFPI